MNPAIIAALAYALRKRKPDDSEPLDFPSNKVLIVVATVLALYAAFMVWLCV